MRGDGVAVARQQRRIEQALRRRVGAVLQARLEAGLVGETHGARELQQPRRRAASEVVRRDLRSEEHTSELQSLMRISHAGFCLKNKNEQEPTQTYPTTP